MLGKGKSGIESDVAMLCRPGDGSDAALIYHRVKRAEAASPTLFV